MWSRTFEPWREWASVISKANQTCSLFTLSAKRGGCVLKWFLCKWCQSTSMVFASAFCHREAETVAASPLLKHCAGSSVCCFPGTPLLPLDRTLPGALMHDFKIIIFMFLKERCANNTRISLYIFRNVKFIMIYIYILQTHTYGFLLYRTSTKESCW